MSEASGGNWRLRGFGLTVEARGNDKKRFQQICLKDLKSV